MPWRSEQLLEVVTDCHCPPSSGPGDHLCVCEVDSQFCQLVCGRVQSDTTQQGLPASIQILIILLLYPKVLGGVEDSHSCLEWGFPAVEKLIRQKGG